MYGERRNATGITLKLPEGRMERLVLRSPGEKKANTVK
jgi:hypothetical protein